MSEGEYTDSTLVIEELDGRKRRLELRGGGLPHMGAAWKSGQGLVTTWYPGNPEGSQQVLGPREMPSTWEGTWRRTMLGRAPCTYKDEAGEAFVTAPWVLRDIVDDILRSGSLLYVMWRQSAPEQRLLRTASTSSAQGNPLVKTGATNVEPRAVIRTGRAKEWEFPHDRLQDIKWTINFEWVGRGVPQARVANTRLNDIDNADQGIADIQRQIEQVQTLTKAVAFNRAIPLSASAITLGQLEALADYPQQLVAGFLRSVQQQVSGINRLLGIIKKIKNTPAELAAMFVDFARNTVAIGNQFHDDMTRRSHEQNSLDNSVKSLLTAAKVFGKTLEQQRALSREAKTQELNFRKLLSTNPGGAQASGAASGALSAAGILKVYVSKKGDTPMGLSSKFYNTPDMATEIMKVNHLPWYTTEIAPGTVVVIPVVKS